MKLWGKIRFNPRKRLYYIDGMWQGKRRNIYSIPTRSSMISCKTIELAQHLQLEISREIAQGIFQPRRYKKTKPLNMAGFARNWLEIKKPNIAYKTWEGYRGRIHKYIIPLLGDEYISYINHERLQLFVNELQSRGLALKTVKNCYALVYQILNDAHKSGYVSQLPAPITFQMPIKAIEWLTRDKQEAILAEIPERHRHIFRFLFVTGCRPSEARALRKKDIKEDHILIRKTFAPGPGRQVLGIVKNRREQAIPLTAWVAEILEAIPPNVTPWIFLNPDTSRPYTKNINRDIWNPACERALGYRFDLKNAGRHSLANQMLAAGIPIEEVSAQLRHSNTSVTKNNYARPNLKIIGNKIDEMRKRG